MSRDEVLSRLAAVIHSVLRRCTVNQHTIDDLRQDVLLKCLKHEYDTGELPSDRFVAVIARHEYISWLRKQRTTEWPTGRDEESSEEDPADMAVQTEQKMLLASLLMRLPPRYQDVVRLYIVENWTQNRIARAMGLSINTVKSQLRRAVILLAPAVSRYFAN